MTKFTFIFCTILDIFNDDPFCLLYEEFMVQNRLYHNKLLEKFILLFDDTHGVYIDGKGRRTRIFIFSACYLFSSFDSSLPPLTNSLHHATVFFSLYHAARVRLQSLESASEHLHFLWLFSIAWFLLSVYLWSASLIL